MESSRIAELNSIEEDIVSGILTNSCSDEERPEYLAQIYRRWVKTYDEAAIALPGADDHNVTIANIAAHYIKSFGEPILDLCCGTGLTGRALKSLGFTTIDGLDASHEMLEVARQKSVYRHLFEEFVQPDGIKSVQKASYSAVLTSASFAPNHLEPKHVTAIADVIKPGGHFFTIIHEDFIVHEKLVDLPRQFQQLCDNGVWELVMEKKLEPENADGDVAIVFAYRKL